MYVSLWCREHKTNYHGFHISFHHNDSMWCKATNKNVFFHDALGWIWVICEMKIQGA